MITEGKAFDILDDLLTRNFPEIKRRNIKLAFVKKQYYYMAVSWRITHFRIAIDNEIRKFSEVAFTGCLAHELAHVCDLQESNILHRAVRLFVFSESEEKEERRIDKKVIEKNLGIELLQFHTEHCKIYKPYKSHEGLTKREIKKAIKGKL